MNNKKLVRLLYPLQTVAVPEFVVARKFVEGRTVDGVSIGSLTEFFKESLLDRTETGVEAGVMNVYKLLVSAKDLPEYGAPGVISRIGREQKTRLAHFHQFLAHKQSKKDYAWAGAYLQCEEGEDDPFVVHAIWCCGGYHIGASKISCSRVWGAGQQFASLA